MKLTTSTSTGHFAMSHTATAVDPATTDFAKATDAEERIRRVRLLPFSADPKRYDMMIAALRDLGFRVHTDWAKSTVHVRRGRYVSAIPASEADLFVGNSGTTMRFLTAMVSLGGGRYRLDGVSRMRERPIEDLLAALHIGLAVARIRKRHHAGLIVRSRDPRRIETLLSDYAERFSRDFLATMPAPERPGE